MHDAGEENPSLRISSKVMAASAGLCISFLLKVIASRDGFEIQSCLKPLASLLRADSALVCHVKFKFQEMGWHFTVLFAV